MVIVLVDQGNPHLVFCGEMTGAPQTREATTHNNHMLRAVPVIHRKCSLCLLLRRGLTTSRNC